MPALICRVGAVCGRGHAHPRASSRQLIAAQHHSSRNQAATVQQQTAAATVARFYSRIVFQCSVLSSHILEGVQPPGPGLTGARRRLVGSWSTVKISWFWESGSGGQPRVKPHWLLSRPQPLQPSQLLSRTTCCRHLRPRAMQISTFTIPADGAAQITAQVGL